MLKSLISARGDPRLNFSLENFLCAIHLEMVLFDAILHSKHAYQVANATSILFSELFKFSVEAGIKNYAPRKNDARAICQKNPFIFFKERLRYLQKQKCISLKITATLLCDAVQQWEVSNNH